MPLFCAPTALQRLFHHDGERAVAKAAQKFGTMFGISSLGTISVEEIGSRGGNDLPVTFMGRQTNLHAVWDTAIIEQAVKGDERGYAMRLTRDVTQPELSQWSQGDTISWANESHDVATSAVYAQLQHTGILPDGYEAQALPIVNDQVKRAGVRLAKVLNDCLR
jgi:isopentenyl diphosphate isomerase/L-lactate dehydrogenase-like FMN-dependent dehydrogenase